MNKRLTRITESLRPETPFKNKYSGPASLHERMKKTNSPGVSIAVINDWKIESAQGFGLKEWGKPDAVNDKTLFQAASISKPVFTLAVMRLAQEGKIDLDRDINGYLRSWKIPSSNGWQPFVTLRHIFSHTAGLTVHGFPGYLRSCQVPSVEEILCGQSPANTDPVVVNALPGMGFRYSGGGFTVAQLVITEVLGISFPEFMREFLLAPLGMEDSTYEQPLPTEREVYAATGHPQNNAAINGKWHVYPEMAAAGLWTTPTDLAKLGIEMQRTLKGEGSGIFTRDSITTMVTPCIKDQMGIGFMLEGNNESRRFCHSGWNEGFVGKMTFYRDSGKGSVIMVNSNDGYPLLDEIERAIACEYSWQGYFPEGKKEVFLSAEKRPLLTGTYESEKNPHQWQRCLVTLEGEKVILTINGQTSIELHAESDTNFFIKELDVEVHFDADNMGQATSMTIEQESGSTTLKRTGVL